MHVAQVIRIDKTKKRNSTDWNLCRERIRGVRFLRRMFGTYLGVLYENTAYAGVNGIKWNA